MKISKGLVAFTGHRLIEMFEQFPHEVDLRVESRRQWSKSSLEKDASFEFSLFLTPAGRPLSDFGTRFIGNSTDWLLTVLFSYGYGLDGASLGARMVQGDESAPISLYRMGKSALVALFCFQ
jgi:hypothetical protein